jgi:hypothetical protein
MHAGGKIEFNFQRIEVRKFAEFKEEKTRMSVGSIGEEVRSVQPVQLRNWTGSIAFGG